MSQQPVQIGADLGDDGAPRFEWDSAQWRQRLL
jgi:hypothetical protein